MIKTFVLIGLGAIIVFSPLAAVAQSATGTAHAGGGGSHSRHIRHSRSAHKERARGGQTHGHGATRPRRSQELINPRRRGRPTLARPSATPLRNARLRDRTGLRTPNVPRVVCDRTVTRELA